ncbi:MAG: MMPL family transporter [Nitrospiraceae bacterium]|nr:MAG: MMPL family transporter [Nitrospiraceae bacterium]
MASQIPSLIMDTSAEGLLHKDDPALMEYESFRRQFGREQMIIIGLKPADVFDAAFLRLLKDFHEALEEEVPHVGDISSLVNAEYIHGDEDDVTVEELLDRLPETDAEMNELRTRILNSPLYRDTVISEDGTFTVIVLEPAHFSAASENKNILLTEKERSEFFESVRVISDRFRTTDFPVYLSGDITVEEVLKKMTMNTMLRFTVLTSLVIVIVFTILFRRVSAVLLPVIVVNAALLSTVGLMAVFGAPVTLNSTVLPSFLLAVGIGDSVHILAIYYKHLKRHGDKNAAIAFSLGHSGLAVVMTSITTAGGLMSFVNSGIAPVASLGIFAAVGVLLALIFSVVMLPAMLAVTPVRNRGVSTDHTAQSGLDRFLAGVGDVATAHPWKIVFISCIIFIASLVLALQLKFSHNSLNYIREDVPIRIDTELIDKEMKGTFNIEVVLHTHREHGLYEPDVMKKIEHIQRMFQEMVVSDRSVGRAMAVTDIVKEINSALNNEKPSEYRVPDSRELIAQELLLYEIGGGENLDELIDRDYMKSRITVRGPWVDAVAYDKALVSLDAELKSLNEGETTVSVTGLVSIIVRTLSAIIRSMGESYLIAGIVITCMMIFLIGNIRMGLCSMAPNFLPIVLGLGLMKIIYIPLDYSTIMIGGIAIGLAVDDTVHFMHNFRRYYHRCGDAREAVRQTLLTTGRAMLFTTIILACGFFILLLAELKSTNNFGIITGFTIIMALLADFLLAPAIMVLLTGKKRT